jgi:histidinol-phosphatase
LDQIDDWITAAEAAADAAGATCRRHFRTSIGADQKTDESPVTIADREAEQALRRVLAERLPAFGLIGEEFPPVNPEARCVWVVDPIDGTRAFITGRTTFCVLIGLLVEGVPVLGVIDQPVTGERWIGVAGRGTRFRGRFGGTVGPKPTTRLDQAELSCSSPDMFGPAHAPRFAALKNAALRTSFGGDAYAYGLLALGQIDLVAEASLQPYDWAALVPVIEGAGGVITDWAGAPLRLGCDGTALAAATPALHAAALDVLRTDGP